MDTIHHTPLRGADLTSQPVPRLIWRLAVPVSVGFFFNTMFNVVDTFYAGTISTQALAALSLTVPVFFIIIAIGSGLSAGTTALIGNALGADDTTAARQYALQGLTFGAITSMIVVVAGLLAAPSLFRLLGARDVYLNDCLIYMDIIFDGTLFFLLNYMLNAILTALGDTRSYRNFLIVGFCVNILLDYWFIAGGLGVPSLGIAGIALSTILIQLGGGVYLSMKVYEQQFLRDRRLHEIIPHRTPFMQIAHQGLPASISMLTVGIGFFVITYFASTFGQAAVAAYGVATRIEQIVLLPTIGLNTAALTLIAHNNGSKRFDRIDDTLYRCLRYGFYFMAAGTIIVFVLSPYLMILFTDDVSVQAIGTVYLRIGSLVFYAYVILFLSIAALQGIKRPLYGIWIGIARQLILPLVVFTFLIDVLHCGIIGIWWGIFAINWSAAVITFVYTRSILKKVAQPSANTA